jgi:hypothetical protein
MASDTGTILVGPGLPEIRLYPGAARIAGVSQHLIPPAPDQTKGRWYPEPERLQLGALPLQQIYLLKPRQHVNASTAGAQPGDQVTGTEAFRALTEHSFWLSSRETRALANDMSLLARVATDVPIRWLVYNLSSTGMDEIARLLPCDVAYQPSE